MPLILNGGVLLVFQIRVIQGGHRLRVINKRLKKSKKNLENRFIKMNQSVVGALGLDNPVNVIGRTDFDFFVEAHTCQAFENGQKIIQTGQLFLNEEEEEICQTAT